MALFEIIVSFLPSILVVGARNRTCPIPIPRLESIPEPFPMLESIPEPIPELNPEPIPGSAPESESSPESESTWESQTQVNFDYLPLSTRSIIGPKRLYS